MMSPSHNKPTLLAERNDLTGLVASGPDRSSWLMGMITCDLRLMNGGHAVYGLTLDKRGKVLADLVAFELDDRIALAVDAAHADPLREHLDHYLIMEDAEIERLEEPSAFIEVFGPDAARVVRAARELPGVLAAATGILHGTEGGIIMARADAANAMLESLSAHASVMTSDEFERERVRRGMPKLGRDFDDSSYPGEVGLDDHAISFNKGCYVGQEVVLKLRARGKPVRVLRRLLIEGGEVPAEGTVVTTSAGKDIGKITSAEPEGNGAVAFALLRRADIEAVDSVLVGGRAARVTDAWGEL